MILVLKFIRILPVVATDATVWNASEANGIQLHAVAAPAVDETSSNLSLCERNINYLSLKTKIFFY